jgi:hypothetical protein
MILEIYKKNKNMKDNINIPSFEEFVNEMKKHRFGKPSRIVDNKYDNSKVDLIDVYVEFMGGPSFTIEIKDEEGSIVEEYEDGYLIHDTLNGIKHKAEDLIKELKKDERKYRRGATAFVNFRFGDSLDLIDCQVQGENSRPIMHRSGSIFNNLKFDFNFPVGESSIKELILSLEETLDQINNAMKFIRSKVGQEFPTDSEITYTFDQD